MSDEVNEVTQADECGAIYIMWSADSNSIRKWDWKPFDGAEMFARLRTAASQASAGEGLRVLKGWLDWYRFATGDDDCEYLNDKGWDDAEALASTTMGVLAALTTPVEASQPVGDAGERRQRIIADINAAIGLGEHGVTIDVEQAADSILASLSPPTSDERLREALSEAKLTLEHARTFITSRQKMHADGVALFDEALTLVRAAIGATP